MIVTLTANPSNDRTVQLREALARGEVQRAETATVEPGGKGVNVSRVVRAAEVPTVAVFPVGPEDPFLGLVRGVGIEARAVPVGGQVRTNLTLAESDGTTTKINEPGPTLTDEHVAALVDAVVETARGATWAVLSGSLPPGAPDDLYATVVGRLADADCRVAVDTSGAPLQALVETDGPAADLIKPNAEELASIVGGDPDELEADPASAARAASVLLDRGIGTVLVTLGAAGTLAVTPDGTWAATPPRVEARSTVGAGDSSLAGWVLAALAGDDVEGRIRRATACGAAAVALPGTALPTPRQLALDDVVVERLTPSAS